MEAMIPKLFILTAEASIVLLLILLMVFIFSSKAKRKDVKAANELVRAYVKSKEERITAIKNTLSRIGFSGDADAQAEKLYDEEKGLIKEFVTLYLKHDTYRLLEYSETVAEVNNTFLKVSGSAQAAAPEAVDDVSAAEENANATIMAREQAELNEAHLKELSELRLKNTELNEHLFEALETVTSLMTEHGKKTGQEVETNAQKILDAIIYLRDNRLGQSQDPSAMTPSPDDTHDQVDSPWSIDLADKDATLDDSPAVNLEIGDELDTDLDKAEALVSQEPAADTTHENEAEPEPTEDDDPWAEALSEQSEAEAESPASEPVLEEEIPTVNEEADPWADALAEQANAETPSEPPAEVKAEPEPTDEDDPWAAALAEQADAEAQADSDSPAGTTDEDDPWAAALAEQAATEASSEAPAADTEEDDPWAAALAEQEQADKK